MHRQPSVLGTPWACDDCSSVPVSKRDMLMGSTVAAVLIQHTVLSYPYVHDYAIKITLLHVLRIDHKYNWIIFILHEFLIYGNVLKFIPLNKVLLNIGKCLENIVFLYYMRLYSWWWELKVYFIQRTHKFATCVFLFYKIKLMNFKDSSSTFSFIFHK